MFPNGYIGMTDAIHLIMNEMTPYQIKLITNQIKKSLENIADSMADSPDQAAEKMKKINRESGKKYAKKLGLKFNEKIEMTIRNTLCEKIISEFGTKKITHQELANCIHASRPKVTNILNRKLKGISIGFLVRLLMALGTNVRISFDSP